MLKSPQDVTNLESWEKMVDPSYMYLCYLMYVATYMYWYVVVVVCNNVRMYIVTL